ncbi:MAG TPA: threonine/serine exporter family protein [Candidatus Bacteroides merdigallinarum]|uniref:Threonine/serine exporter family protein n=1 Tax=Candidatus Bacteroides merdigallinarum TaxID=2838473 RepID=A0A9D2EAP7_9BACE|nr:threonine/serine exporter family protein [Candidatus Bacteroides merdigallinarum]
MHTKNELKDIAHFLLEYAGRLMGSGVHTSRVVRNTCRLGQSQDVEVSVSVIQKNLIVNVRDPESREAYTEMADTPAFPISFELNAELSALSWDAHDQRLPLSAVRERYAEIVARPKMDPLCVLFLTAFANASFCALFGGDWTSRGIVFSATLIGFYLRQVMQRKHINHYIVFILSALAASLVASSALTLDTTAEVAIATSVLYLVPGVPLLNGVIDIVEGYVTTGVCRLIQALLLVLCIAIGLSVTLMLVRNSLL